MALISYLAFTEQDLDDLAELARVYLHGTIPDADADTYRRRLLAQRIVLELSL